MAAEKRKPNLTGLLVIGCGLVAVGIATKNYGLMGAGVLFIIIGAAAVVRKRKGGSEDDDTDS